MRTALSLLAAALTFAPAAACQAPGGFGGGIGYALGDPATRAAQEWARLASDDGAACRAALRAAGVRFRPLPDRAGPDARGCGIPHGVVVTRGPSGITYDAPLVIDCSLARALPEVEAAIQAAAAAHLGHAVTRVGTLGSYACRPIRGPRGNLSEHAFGNAMDLARFTLRRGPAAVVVRDYERDAAQPTTARGRFLRDVEARLRGLGSVSFVIGPAQNDDHRDHFHVDRAWRWWRTVFAAPRD